ncbi:unnamed protein product [Camellia sinensis]
MGGSVRDMQSKGEVDSVMKDGSPVIIHFWAFWCQASKQMDQLFSHLSTDFPHSHFLRVEAEEQPEISEAYSVSAVPYFVFLKVTEKDIVFCLDGETVDTLEDADPSSLANKVAKIAGSIAHGEPAAPASLGMAAGPTILEIVTLCLVERFGKRFGKEKGKGKELLGGSYIAIAMHESGELKEVSEVMAR